MPSENPVEAMESSRDVRPGDRLETRRLAALVKQKRALLEQLQQLCQRQAETIDRADAERLLRILTAKHKLLSSLQQVERELDPYRQQDPQSRQWPSEAEREACRSDAQVCESLWNEIIDLEERCGGELKRQREAVAEQLAQVRGQSHARSAYLNTPVPAPCQFDCQAE